MVHAHCNLSTLLYPIIIKLCTGIFTESGSHLVSIFIVLVNCMTLLAKNNVILSKHIHGVYDIIYPSFQIQTYQTTALVSRFFNFVPSFKLRWCHDGDLFCITNSRDNRNYSSTKDDNFFNVKKRDAILEVPACVFDIILVVEKFFRSNVSD